MGATGVGAAGVPPPPGAVKVALLCPDLLFGSRVESGLQGAGHEVERVKDAAAAAGSDLLVVDLGEGVPDLPGPPLRTLGFYSHVDVETRRRAEAVGFDMVVPRSRMAREMIPIVERLMATAA